MRKIINKLGHKENMQNTNNRGQVAMFIIVALVIVAILLVIFLYPRFGPKTEGKAFSPNSFLQSCIEPKLKPVIAQFAQHGGYLTPEGTIDYKGNKVKYLCYTNEYYKTCVNQQPLIKENFENNLAGFVNTQASQCLKDLKSEYERQQYATVLGAANTSVSIVQGEIKINIKAPITVTKDTTQTFNNFEININSQIYDLLLTASSIVEFESTFGNAETTLYMQYYPNLKITKDQLSDGTRVYGINNVVTNETFTFASRSVAWPPGYGA